MNDSGQLLDQLVNQVLAADKYSSISPETVRAIGKKELAKRRSIKEAVKATRNKLHQVGSSYQETSIPYHAWAESLSALSSNLQESTVKEFLLDKLKAHTSTRERLSILPRFYFETLEQISPVDSILDVACGLNPLSIPWMPLAKKFTYTASDIYQDMAGFLNQFFLHFNINGEVYSSDLTQYIPTTEARLALVLKTIPCLEQMDKEIGSRLLAGLNTEYILVSFPAHSLGGRSKGMVRNYESHFLEITSAFSWKITRFEFPGELAFLVQK